MQPLQGRAGCSCASCTPCCVCFCVMGVSGLWESRVCIVGVCLCKTVARWWLESGGADRFEACFGQAVLSLVPPGTQACVLVEDGPRAVVLAAGSGRVDCAARQLVSGQSSCSTVSPTPFCGCLFRWAGALTRIWCLIRVSRPTYQRYNSMQQAHNRQFAGLLCLLCSSTVHEVH